MTVHVRERKGRLLTPIAWQNIKFDLELILWGGID